MLKRATTRNTLNRRHLGVALMTMALIPSSAFAVSTVTGTSGADTLAGTSADETVLGLRGNDVLNGGDGNDLVKGGNGADTVSGDAGNDVVHGGNGNDTVDGGEGDDILWANRGVDTVIGGAGNDVLNAHAHRDARRAGHDTLDGGDGDDTFKTRDREADSITCGAGTDTALLDYVDVIADATSSNPNGSCEVVKRRHVRR